MEELLTIEAEAKFLLAPRDRSHEERLMQELLKIFKEAELLLGPRDTSFQLSTPRFTECATSRSYIFRPLGTTRIYLSRDAKVKPWLASVELAHEAVHVMSPMTFGSSMTILEEGLAEYFGQRYAGRVHGYSFDKGANPKADAVLRAVSTLMAKDESVIKKLRIHQPIVSRIDEKLLVEVGGVERSQAKFLCTNFQSYWGNNPLSDLAAKGAERVAACLRSIWR